MKRTKPRPNTRERILKAAGLLFSQKGYFPVSMQDIADEVGVSKPALYYYFQSKIELCRALIEKSFRDLNHELASAVKKGKTPADKLFNLIVAYYNFALERPEVKIIFKEGFGEEEIIEGVLVDFRIKLLSLFKKVIKKAGRQADKPFVHLSLTASFLASILSWPFLLTQTTPKQLAKNLIEFFFPEESKKSLSTT